jgi:hypothetical protein
MIETKTSSHSALGCWTRYFLSLPFLAPQDLIHHPKPLNSIFYSFGRTEELKEGE